MKNVTITLEEEVARWVRVLAARENTSVSRLVGEMLRQRMLAEDGYQTAMRRFLKVRPVTLKSSGKYPGREEVHDRKGLRRH